MSARALLLCTGGGIGDSLVASVVVRASYPCHPGDTKENCADYACIANLNVPRILAALDSLLA